jgi:hypothetical protein
MGEAKWKKEAVLNGPCPCGSAKSARLCCFNGHEWHKLPAVLGLKALPPASRVEKCYMKELGSCVGPVSGDRRREGSETSFRISVEALKSSHASFARPVLASEAHFVLS